MIAALLHEAYPERQVSEWLLDSFGGVSPLIARELAFRAGGAADVRLCSLDESGRAALLSEITRLNRYIKDNNFTPILLIQNGEAFDYTFFPILQYGPDVEQVREKSFSGLLERFYEERDWKDRVRKRGQDLRRAAQGALERTQRRLNLQRKELQEAAQREDWKRQGDIIMANLHRMQKGMTVLRAQDFYDPEGKECTIEIDPLLTPQQNAARYYKKYGKLKTADEALRREIEKGEQEQAYLQSVLSALELAEGEQDLREIRRELVLGGYLKQEEKGSRRKPVPPAAPMSFVSSAGFSISVGKNNAQNDQLTMKIARREDLWFHVRQIPGSHVVLKTEGREPDEQSIREAALLAAYYSAARDAKNVAVDYTQVRYVKKPGGAKPGMVTYGNNRTVYVTPEKEAVERLREGC